MRTSKSTASAPSPRVCVSTCQWRVEMVPDIAASAMTTNTESITASGDGTSGKRRRVAGPTNDVHTRREEATSALDPHMPHKLGGSTTFTVMVPAQGEACSNDVDADASLSSHRGQPSTNAVDATRDGGGLGRITWWPSPADARATDRGARLLEHLLGMPISVFENENLFRKPYTRLLSPVDRDAAMANPSHPMHMLTLTDSDVLLRRKLPSPARYTDDVDVTRWVDDRRVALATGRELVDADRVWHAFRSEGYSVRLVHPQQWHDPLWELCGCMQEYFGNVVTCSSYLTPARTQGFGPHFDDCEIFVVQLLGAKRWRLYERPDKLTAPRTLAVTGFAEVELGPPTAEFVLRAGDVVYFPRGTVHQAVAEDDPDPSFHITFSTYRRQTWFDLMSLAVSGPAAGILTAAVAVPGPLHDDLPLDLLELSTVGHPGRAWRRFSRSIDAALTRVTAKGGKRSSLRAAVRAGLDGAIEAYAERYLRDALPPPGVPTAPMKDPPQISAENELKVAYRRSVFLCNTEASTRSQNLDQWSDPQLIEDPEPVLVLRTCVLNSRVYHGSASVESPAFEVLPELAAAVTTLLDGPSEASRTDREWIRVDQLPVHEDASEDLFTLLGLLVQHHVLDLR